MPELDWSNAPIQSEIKANWKSPEILVSGSLNCAKTTVGLDKEIDALLRWPGIPILLARWTQDACDTKLRPVFEEILTIRGLTWEWDAKEKRYLFPNGSIAYCFGLKAVSQIEIFNKIRGLGVCRIFIDQTEELDRSVAGELRGRLRPNLTATVTGRSFPFQLTFVANAEDYDFWLSREFPEDNHISGRTLYQLSIFDNPHAPQASIDSLVRQYPADHPKHRTLVLGRRGPNITGDPVFENLYKKESDWRQLMPRHDMPILEAFEMGTHNPTWVAAQAIHTGGMNVLGGIRGEGLILDDFFAVVDKYRRTWFPEPLVFDTCVPPMGENLKRTGQRYTMLDIIRKRMNIKPKCRDTGNAPDVRLAMVENISTYLRKRDEYGYAQIAVNNDETRFLIVNSEGVRESPFVHHALEAGAVWDDHFVSVANKEIKQMHEDDKFANAMHCIEDIELNFLAGQKSAAEKAVKRIKRLHQFDWMAKEPTDGEMSSWGI